MTPKQNHTDIVKKAWLEKIPQCIQPYLYLMRLDRPIGTWLLLLPAWWAIFLTGGISAWQYLVVFAIGAIVMRGAGCVVNDLWDRDLDGQVERTATRPIPNGDVTPKQAFVFLISLLVIGLFILLQFNMLTIALGIVSLIFIGVYPLMKRITWWPQAFLGLTFNFGALMGWSAITGELPWQAWALYVSGVFWTLGYDTLYAMQDRTDDMMIGIKSSARWLTERYKGNLQPPLYIFYCAHFLVLLWVMWSMELSWMMIFMIMPFGHLMWQIKTFNIDDPQNALNRFKSNRDYGLMICAIIILLTAI